MMSNTQSLAFIFYIEHSYWMGSVVLNILFSAMYFMINIKKICVYQSFACREVCGWAGQSIPNSWYIICDHLQSNKSVQPTSLSTTATTNSSTFTTTAETSTSSVFHKQSDSTALWNKLMKKWLHMRVLCFLFVVRVKNMLHTSRSNLPKITETVTLKQWALMDVRKEEVFYKQQLVEI